MGRQLGVHPEALRGWVKQAEIGNGTRRGTSTEDQKRIAELERENRELRRANRDIEGGECVFRPGTRPQASALAGFIDSHRDRFGVEPVCAVLEFPVSTYYAVKKRERYPSAREVRDEYLKEQIMRVWENRRKGRGVYGARKVWLQLRREGIEVARCTVERLMGDLGIAGISAQRKKPRTTVPDGRTAGPLTCWSGTSPRLRRTAAGSPISPMCPRPAASCTRRSSQTCSPARSSAGRSRTT